MVMNDMTDDGKWGAAIPIVDGKRPEWLEDDDVCALLLDGNLLDGDGKMTAANWVWGGTHQFIRLPASHPYYQQTQPQTQTLTAQEHLERLEAFVRKAAAHVSPMAQYSVVRDHLGDEARALVAEMEPVVDADLVEARRIAGDALAGFTNGLQGFATGVINAVRTGNDDAHPAVVAALAAIKRGRELARGEG